MTDKLRSTCDCGQTVRVLWSGPIGPSSRPIQLACHFYPDTRCDFTQLIPAEKVEMAPGDEKTWLVTVKTTVPAELQFRIPARTRIDALQGVIALLQANPDSWKGEFEELSIVEVVWE